MLHVGDIHTSHIEHIPPLMLYWNSITRRSSTLQMLFMGMKYSFMTALFRIVVPYMDVSEHTEITYSPSFIQVYICEVHL